jgi:hypothetical protein
MNKNDLVAILVVWGAVCFAAGFTTCGLWLDHCQSRKRNRR